MATIDTDSRNLMLRRMTLEEAAHLINKHYTDSLAFVTEWHPKLNADGSVQQPDCKPSILDTD